MLIRLFGAVIACGSLTMPLPASQASTATVPSPEQLVRAWRGLTDPERAEAIEWFVAECDNARGFRAKLEQFVLTEHGSRRFDWPEASAGAPVYDTNVHTPGLVIPRRFVEESSARYKRTYKSLVGDRREREILQAFRYDWGRGTVVKLAAWDDPERIALNAARGFSPYTDLVEALVEMQLDGDALRAEAAAFSHAYSDRQGNAYRTITLYDAWSSGAKIEMPDVECLGILHDLEDDWRSFVSPVPDSKHRRLYDRIGEHYARLRKHRALRTAIARAYVQASPELPTEYETGVMRLHGFWEIQSSDPSKMAADLPTVDGWLDWFVERGEEADETPEIVEGARARSASLLASREWTRRTFHGILKEYDAFSPKPPKKAEPAPQGGGDGR